MEEPNTKEAYERWHTPKASLDLLQPHFPRQVAVTTITRRLSKGLIASRCKRLLTDFLDKEMTEHFMPVLKGCWSSDQYRAASHEFWISGDAIFVLRAPGASEIVMHCFGVRFNPEGIADLIPERAVPDARSPLREAPIPTDIAARDATDPVSGAGRPTKAFWEDAIIAVFKRVYDGDLHPKRLADVERALSDWLILNNHDAGETAVRERARRIWIALGIKVGN